MFFSLGINGKIDDPSGAVTNLDTGCIHIKS